VALLLRATRIHRSGTTGRGVVVAMIDTGHYRHPFFNEHGYRLLPTLLGPGASDPSSDLSGHGTGESANIFAAAPDIQLRPIKDAGDPVGAFNVAVASTPKPQVISNSWGYNIDFPGATLNPYLKALEAAIANAVASNIVVCFSAGNGHQAFPASHPDVIAVGGVHVNYPGLDFEASSYASSFVSNLYPGRAVPDVCGLTGKRVTIGGAGLAPSLLLPVQPGSALDNIAPPTGAAADGWGLFSGTSAACPQVAGVVALLLEKDPTLTPAKVKEILSKSARDVTAGTTANGGIAGPGPDAATGAGLVDAKWAWIVTMGDVAAHSFEMLLAAQAQPVALLNGGNGKGVHFNSEMMSDLMATLRSR
jgi:subtilisin family serine protease